MNITKHAQERYAERIMSYDEKTDINRFISLNSEKIKTDLEKMIEFGTCIYSGPSIKQQNSIVDIYLKDFWVILVDKAKDNIITVFKVDLGVGEEFTKEYIDKILEKLEMAKQNHESVVQAIESQVGDYKELINENEQEINHFKKIIKSLEQQNESYKSLVNELNTNKKISEQQVRDVIEIFTGGKTW